MKNFPPIFKKDEMIMTDLTSHLKDRKLSLVNSYTNWSIQSIPIDSILQEVKISNEKNTTAIKMDVDSLKGLLKFLRRVI